MNLPLIIKFRIISCMGKTNHVALFHWYVFMCSYFVKQESYEHL